MDERGSGVIGEEQLEGVRDREKEICRREKRWMRESEGVIGEEQLGVRDREKGICRRERRVRGCYGRGAEGDGGWDARRLYIPL